MTVGLQMAWYVYAWVAAVVLSHYACRLAARSMAALGVRDVPSALRRHGSPTVRGVGIGMSLVWVAGLGVVMAGGGLGFLIGVEVPVVVCVMVAALSGIGALDDWRGLTARQRLISELCVASVCWAAASSVVGGYIWAVSLILGVWTVGLANAMNMVDGMDGLAAGLALVSSAGLLVAGLWLSEEGVVWCSVLLAGVLVGFLPLNWPRARAFMGDSGSLFLGASIGVTCALLLESTGLTVSRLVACMCFAGIPAVDAMATVSRRLLFGMCMMSGDHEHAYELWSERLCSRPRAVSLCWLVQAASCAGGVIIICGSGTLQLLAGILVLVFWLAYVWGAWSVRSPIMGA